MDSHRHDSAIQEIAEHVCLSACVYACVIPRSPVCVCACVCLYGSFKGSECGGLPFHRMSAVVQLWSTARPYIWNTEKIHQGYLLPLFSGPVFHRFVRTCVFWVHICVWISVCACMGNSAPLCCTLCPWYFKAFWPHVMSVRCISKLQLDDRSERNPYGGQERQEEWGERKARRVIEGFRAILRPRMAVSTCLHNLLELNI